MRGSGTITYQNGSPDTLPALLFRLDQNLYAPGVTRNRPVSLTGGTTITRLAIGRRELGVLSAQRGGGYRIDGTIMVVVLPDPLMPDATVELDISWEHSIPAAPTFRGGGSANSIFTVAQWYPRLAVYDDINGWDQSPYLGDGEFYLDYGEFDVSVTLPAGWVVAATGTLVNADSVLAAEVLDRYLLAQQSDSMTPVVADPALGTTLGGFGDRLTWRYIARDVRDFAFSTSPGYAWYAGQTSSGTLLQAFYRPQSRWWSDAWPTARHALEQLSRDVLPYPYPQFSVVEAPLIDASEYPMVGAVRTVRTSGALNRSILHTVAHQWFPMLVGTREAQYAWMDEGIATYYEGELDATLRNVDPPAWGAQQAYLEIAGSERDAPLMRHSDLLSPFADAAVVTRVKAAVALATLREAIGAEPFAAVLRDVARNWFFKHPEPWDFFATTERLVGRRLDGFWLPMFFGTGTVDHAVSAVEHDGTVTRITVEQIGDVTVPVDVRITRLDGTYDTFRIDAAEWDGASRVTHEVAGDILTVEVDPMLRLPDVDRANNDWRRDEDQ